MSALMNRFRLYNSHFQQSKVREVKILPLISKIVTNIQVSGSLMFRVPLSSVYDMLDWEIEGGTDARTLRDNKNERRVKKYILFLILH